MGQVMAKLSILSLAPLHRAGHVSASGSSVTARDSLDFVVDGEALSSRVSGDYASCLGWGTADWEASVVEKLLARAEPVAPPNRVALYICPECGDLGCGAVTAAIERDGPTIIWHTFGYENDYDEAPRYDWHQHLGPFRFDAIEYERVLRASYTEAGKHRDQPSNDR